MTLVNLIKLGKAMELSESQSKEMNNAQQEDVNKVSRRKVNPSNFSRGRSTYIEGMVHILVIKLIQVRSKRKISVIGVMENIPILVSAQQFLENVTTVIE